VRQLVELQGGTVGVDAADTGGSIFWMALPIWSEESDLDETKPDRSQVLLASKT